MGNKKVQLTLPFGLYRHIEEAVESGEALTVPEFIRRILNDYFFNRNIAEEAKAEG
jgi:hypothetical protein